ncbi:hypothetical protein H0A36_28785 [Endozoicomonas sp. SM1973]|uniref:Uncharacterized protein n=1 Tax=Spartinivicinus marinus TaxID=2994442 RepID=A0A853ILU8_9GAMM|nr:hypothetical protein [Spartinivicinus marinus]MCX4025202.1 hypothetical protein [Spartinivicinus marinus]MCX4027881.1 hypothetical protein [Spartinivicinus marinus]NYZ70015.1 hypothetical protein [Spartinivicinus marinus]
MESLLTANIDTYMETQLQDILQHMMTQKTRKIELKLMDGDGNPEIAVVLITEDIQTYLDAIDKTEKEIKQAEQ